LQRIGFTEVSGLSIVAQAAAFRDGSTAANSIMAMPGLLRYPHHVPKRAVRKSDNQFFEWINPVRLNAVKRRDLRRPGS
jgi:phage tail-like protein